ncbi:major facilitator superfamily protein [Nitrobacter sp. Nb-311A]|uniref:MFS transporter n=1 Tax=unclassified Nitrobacter TaxID=2620411 RepID=UPI00006870A3|nr:MULTISPECIES: MFS transporter [unclassified Nitrobacter]EAQ35799.1 major facilitator superfamily protein [Nitrobacter sp. Nb-311A]MCB1393291.1 MFS transporter [Nitrobacter sp.]MCV0386362.1 MFS transporter [Nitrobacter sp.]
MDKPVISEETLTAPVVVPEITEKAVAAGPAYLVLGGISFSHFLNDTMQSLIPSVYPILKENYALDFAQVGMITLAFQVTASLLQPVVGYVTDKKAQPFSLAIGMGFTFVGLLLLSGAHVYGMILVSAALIGLGSAVFHPESARIARMASGGRYGFAQSVFQVGGNFGAAMGPLLAALIIVPFGQSSIAWFSSIAFVAIVLLFQIGRWYKPRIAPRKSAAQIRSPEVPTRARIMVALAILIVLVFSKFIYMSSLTSYYTFYLIEKFHVSTQTSQLLLFVFLGAVATGVYFGGPIGDRFGRRYVIWLSILGVLPFTLLLPFANLAGTVALTVIIGVILSSAMPAIIVFAQELMPHRLGMISGMFFGFAFGAAGLGAALLGEIADAKGIEFVYRVCAFLPAIGLLAMFLPKMPKIRPL